MKRGLPPAKSRADRSADIYGFGEKPLDSGYGDTFDILTANSPEGVEQAVYDWHLALSKFYLKDLETGREELLFDWPEDG